MTLLREARHDAPGDATATPTSPHRFWLHVVALGVVLFAVLGVVNTGSMITADEGAVLSQVAITHQTGSWGLENPVPELDPSGKWFAIEGSDIAGGRFYPYVKHAAYPALAGVLDGIGGMGMILAASVAGTVAAALLSALLMRHLAGRLEIATLWIVGLSSPLFFDSSLVAAHTIGAAFAALTMYAVVRWWNAHPMPGLGNEVAPRWWFVPATVIGLIGAVLFRSEGMIFGIALAISLMALAVIVGNRASFALGVLCGAVTIATWRLDGVIHSQIMGRSASAFSINSAQGSWVQGRIDGAANSLLRPQLFGISARGLLLFLLVGLGVVAAFAASHRTSDVRIIRVTAGCAIGCGVLALAAKPSPIPGLLIAFPLVTFGLVAMRRSMFDSQPKRLAAATTVLYTAAILATQYSVGGGMEWGGRFFHLVLPVAVPLLLIALDDTRRRLDRVTARWCTVAFGVVTAVIFVISLGTIIRIHNLTTEVVDGVHEVAASARPADQPGGPIVVSTLSSLGRFTWRDAVKGRFLMVGSPDLTELDRRMVDADVGEFVFAAAFHPTRDVARFANFRPDPTRSRVVGDWHLYVMVPRR